MMNPNRFEKILEFNNAGLITYIMSESFRIHYNHGLLKAKELSDKFGKGLQIILLRVPEENIEHNEFFKKGMIGHERFLSKYTNNVYYLEEDSKFFYSLLKDSTHVIKDRAYLKIQKSIENRVFDYLEENSISLTLVESNVIVPVIYTSNKEEKDTRTLKTIIMDNIDQFDDIQDSNSPTFFYEQEAKEVLEIFLEHKLKNYVSSDDIPTSSSNLEIYLKYGFISPLEIFDKVQKLQNITGNLFIEQFIITRELSHNFIFNSEN